MTAAAGGQDALSRLDQRGLDAVETFVRQLTVASGVAQEFNTSLNVDILAGRTPGSPSTTTAPEATPSLNIGLYL